MLPVIHCRGVMDSHYFGNHKPSEMRKYDINRMEKIILHAISLQKFTYFSGRQLADTCRILGLTEEEIDANMYQHIIYKYCIKHPDRNRSWIRKAINQQLPMELNVKSKEESKVKASLGNSSTFPPVETATIRMTDEEMIEALKATGKYRIYRITQTEI